MKLVVGRTYKLTYQTDGAITTVEEATYDGESVGVYLGCSAGAAVFTDRTDPRHRIPIPWERLVDAVPLD